MSYYWRVTGKDLGKDLGNDHCTHDPAKVCVLYGQDYPFAERNYYCPDLTNIIYTEHFKLDAKEYTTLALYTSDLTSIEHQKLNVAALMRMYHNGIRVFASALGSSVCNYLDLIFFVNHLDAVHINGDSTSTALNDIPNLIRTFPVDKFNIDIFLKLSEKVTQDVLIVHDSQLWSSGINDALLAEAVNYPSLNVNSVAYEFLALDDAGIIAASNDTVDILNTMTNPMLIYVIDSGKGNLYFSTMSKNAAVPASMSILFGDGSLNYDQTDEITAFFTSHSAMVIQPFSGNDVPRMLEIQEELDKRPDPVIPPGFPVGLSRQMSSRGTYFVTTLDMAYYIALLYSKGVYASGWDAKQRYLDVVYKPDMTLAHPTYSIIIIGEIFDVITAVAAVYFDKVYIIDL